MNKIKVIGKSAVLITLMLSFIGCDKNDMSSSPNSEIKMKNNSLSSNGSASMLLSQTNLTGTWVVNLTYTNGSLIGSSLTNTLDVIAQNGIFIGTLPPADNNDSIYEIRIYESPRGNPVVTMVNIAQTIPSPPNYRASFSGRLDSTNVINGRMVDVDNNQFIFQMVKQ